MDKILYAVLISISASCNKEHNIQTASFISNSNFEREQEGRVKEEHLGYSGVTVLTVDGHEYIHYRDGNNAASVGGICHKVDCSYCLSKNNK